MYKKAVACTPLLCYKHIWKNNVIDKKKMRRRITLTSKTWDPTTDNQLPGGSHKLINIYIVHHEEVVFTYITLTFVSLKSLHVEGERTGEQRGVKCSKWRPWRWKRSPNRSMRSLAMHLCLFLSNFPLFKYHIMYHYLKLLTLCQTNSPFQYIISSVTYSDSLMSTPNYFKTNDII